MQPIFRSIKLLSLSLLTILTFSMLFGLNGLVGASAGRFSQTTSTAAQSRTRPLPISASHAFINYRNEGEVGCRDATEIETQALKRRTGQAVHEISSGRGRLNQMIETQSTGLQIILRGTDQLENYP